ncbi:unnamed protein product [Urochloa decumbens]|uniref:F-box domain-containing protein n=1 Tax=Urochloa decumbens TaxID=240449 RepID=A0ABC9C0E0_9POAL
MPRGKRALIQSTPQSSTALVARNKGWLPDRRDPYKSKRPRRDEEDGTQLPNEILLHIFAGFPEIADLVRCAATCRRWRRLVSGEAAFIISSRRHPGRFVPLLALGFFFHHNQQAAAAPRFVPMASASRRFPTLPSPLLDSSSRVVASRNGLVVVDLWRGGGGEHRRALKLCVCNPMTGEAHALPPLTGKDGLGQYACTVLTADDRLAATDPSPPSSYRLLLVYSRRSFTAFRSYSDDGGGGAGWSPEAKVTGAQIVKKHMGIMCNGVVAPGGREAYWLAKDVVFALRLDTMETSVMRLPRSRSRPCRFSWLVRDNTLLGFTPEGRLCAIQLDIRWRSPTTFQLCVALNIHTYRSHSHGGGNQDELWEMEDETIRIESFSMDDNVLTLKLRWFCERSGIILFTADRWLCGDRRIELYAFSIHTRKLEKVVSNGDGSGNDPWGNLYGYEMDQAAYLTSLAEPEREKNML